MLDLRIRNFRSITDSGFLEFRPITIFLGQNSSGKSTFLRTLPLLKQSIRTRSNSPILWYGDYVDFGSIQQIKSSFTDSEKISIDFSLSAAALRDSWFVSGSSTVPFEGINKIALGIDLLETQGATVLRSFSVTADDLEAKIEIDDLGAVKSLHVNDVEFTRSLADTGARVTRNEVVPQFFVEQPKLVNTTHMFIRFRRSVDLIHKAIRSYISSNLHGGVSEGTVTHLSRNISFKSRDEFSKRLLQIPSRSVSWSSFVQYLISENGSSDLRYLRSMYFIYELPPLLSTLDQHLFQFLNATSYVGPFRATGERYYRMQELAVDQIDPEGRNLAMYLYSLSGDEQFEFSEWLLSSIGYGLKVVKEGGHIQICLRERESSSFYNIADMGYGFSQVLPILAQIWSQSQKPVNRYSSQPFVVMEQPELHLHPAYQSRLADIMARAISARKGEIKLNPMKFIVETHSEAIINRIGEMIHEKSISSEDVVIYIFDRKFHDHPTDVRRSMFNQDGDLMNWPISFFSSGA
jgi:predicted ATPase